MHTLDSGDLKRRISLEAVFMFFGSSLDPQGRWRCLFPERHAHGDAHHSVAIKRDRATCWSQRCFERDDIFAVVAKMEGLRTFPQQRARVQELAGLVASNGKDRPLTRKDRPSEQRTSYEIRDVRGVLVAIHEREDTPSGKKCWWRLPDGTLGLNDQSPEDLPLYGIDHVSDSLAVILCEGEKATDALLKLGLTAVGTVTGAAGTPSDGVLRDLLHPGRVIYLWPDHDEPGEAHMEQIGTALVRLGTDVRLMTWSEAPPKADAFNFLQAGGTVDGVRALLEEAEPIREAGEEVPMQAKEFVSPSKTGTLHEREFAPLTAGDFLDLGDEDEAVEWILEDYLPAGGLALLVAKPKEGKSTVAYELAVRVAQGRAFLNRGSHQGGVLILALEEHPRDVRLRLRSLGADRLLNLYVCARPLDCTADTMGAIRRFVSDQGIRLVVMDTLGAFWDVHDENDAAEVTQAMKPFLALARETGACVLLIHHARKSDGSYGDEIRGSGALFAAVDIAIILKRHEIQTQRVLHAVSRYPETPAKLVLDLTETGYVALGDPAALNKQARRDKIKAALSDILELPKVISARAGVALRDGRRLLDALAEGGEAFREGKGRKGSPHRYAKNAIRATPPVLGGTLHESNAQQMEFDSCTPPSPCMNENSPTQEVIDLVDRSTHTAHGPAA